MVNLQRFTINYRLEFPEIEQYFQAEIKENYENWLTRLNKYIEAEAESLKKLVEEIKKNEEKI